MVLNRELILGVLLVLPACGDDAEPDLDDGASDSSGDSDGSASEGADVTGDAIVCDAPAAREVLAFGADILSNLTVTDTAAVMLVVTQDINHRSRIDTVALDGSGLTTLHTGTDAISLVSVFAHGDTVYFLERDYSEPVPLDVLHRVPIAGGVPQPIGTVALEGAAIVDVDDTSIYLVRGTITPVGNVFERVDIASGALTRIGASVDRGGPLQLHASADRLVFHTGGIGDAAGGPRQVSMLPKDGDDVTPTVLWSVAPTDDDPCFLPLTGLYPTPTRIACGFSGVATRALDGSMQQVLVEPDILAQTNILVAVDGEQLYVSNSTLDSEASGHILRLATDDATRTPVACNLHSLAYRLVDGVFPNQTEYEVVVGATEVFWVEQKLGGDLNLYALRAATK
ncbi:MAG: hypothetical protein IAG13_25615 [Deltaproteobacteria bacterium]|nr:hypothetical protein [Nannocystaceae bacterium]